MTEARSAPDLCRQCGGTIAFDRSGHWLHVRGITFEPRDHGAVPALPEPLLSLGHESEIMEAFETYDRLVRWEEHNSRLDATDPIVERAYARGKIIAMVANFAADVLGATSETADATTPDLPIHALPVEGDDSDRSWMRFNEWELTLAPGLSSIPNFGSFDAGYDAGRADERRVAEEALTASGMERDEHGEWHDRVLESDYASLQVNALTANRVAEERIAALEEALENARGDLAVWGDPAHSDIVHDRMLRITAVLRAPSKPAQEAQDDPR